MSRTLTETVISTRNARSKLREGIHWRGIDSDVHLGYRRGRRGGRWLVRWYVGERQYRQETIGSADDATEANGVDCFSFDQAKSAAVKLVEQKRAEKIDNAYGPAPTVRSAVNDYIASRDARRATELGDNATKSDAHRLKRHVLETNLADIALHALKEDDLQSWRGGLSTELAEDTRRRLTNDLKAALNAAAIKCRSRLPANIGIIIKNGLRSGQASPPTARDQQALPDADIRRIIEASREIDAENNWDGDLFRMVLVLAASGGRFSQAARLAVADFQPAQGRLMMPLSRKGRGTKRKTHVAVQIGADIVAALRPIAAGRRSNEPLLERWRHKQIPRGEDGTPPRWVRDGRGAWTTASELTRPWQLILARAGLPSEVVPYALRHSSIVRQLRKGLPVRLVAALHDTSAEMIERHYSAAIVDALDALAAGAVIPLVSADEEKVVRLRG